MFLPPLDLLFVFILSLLVIDLIMFDFILKRFDFVQILLIALLLFRDRTFVARCQGWNFISALRIKQIMEDSHGHDLREYLSLV